MATSTTNYSFSLPEVGGDTDQWGTQLNANWTLADSTIKTIEDSVVDVTLTGNDYLTISGQAITVGDVDLTTDVTGTLPVESGGTGLAALGTANQVLGVNSGGTALEYKTLSTGGTVTSVAVTGSDGIEIDSGSPISSSGTIALGINSTTLSTHLGLGSLATQSTITESQISDLGSYITASSTDTLTNKSGNISQWTNDANYITAESNDLSAAVTWANVPDANITQSSVTQHEAALSITESQISDFGSYQTSDAGLTSIAGLTTAADKMLYTTAADTYAVTALTSAGRALLDDTDAAAQRTTLGLGTAATTAATDYATAAQGATADSALQDLVDDTTPQLGGNLDVNGNSIVSASAGNISITPDTTGKIILDGLSWPTADGSADQVLVTDGAGNLSFVEQNLGLEIGVDVQSFDADTTKNDVANTFTANQIISVTDNTNAALRVTQLGTGHALVVEDSTNPDSTPFVVNASGVVGIGTSSPNELMTIASSSVASYLQICDSSTGSTSGDGLFLGSFNGAAELKTKENTHLSFGTNNTQHMRIDSSGNVGINIAPDSNSKLHILDDTSSLDDYTIQIESYTPAIVLHDISGASTDFAIQVDGSALMFRYGDASTRTQLASEAMRIDTSGNLLVGYTSSNGSYKLQVNSQIYATSSTIATSDFNYKENITPLDGALSLVSQLNPVQFDWKEHPIHEFDRNQPTIGFIAQEVQQVLSDQPYLNSIVKSNECVLEPEETDEEGNVIKEAVIEEFLGIAEGNMIALLTKGIQEQQTLIESQQSQIDALTARIEALETT